MCLRCNFQWAMSLPNVSCQKKHIALTGRRACFTVEVKSLWERWSRRVTSTWDSILYFFYFLYFVFLGTYFWAEVQFRVFLYVFMFCILPWSKKTPKSHRATQNCMLWYLDQLLSWETGKSLIVFAFQSSVLFSWPSRSGVCLF